MSHWSAASFRDTGGLLYVCEKRSNNLMATMDGYTTDMDLLSMTKMQIHTDDNYTNYIILEQLRMARKPSTNLWWPVICPKSTIPSSPETRPIPIAKPGAPRVQMLRRCSKMHIFGYSHYSSVPIPVSSCTLQYATNAWWVNRCTVLANIRQYGLVYLQCNWNCVVCICWKHM